MTFPKKIFIKVFAVYITILLPICILSLYSVFSLGNTLNESVQSEQQHNLSEIEKDYVEFYNSYKQLALLSTITYPTLSSEKMLSEPSARTDGIDILKNLLIYQSAQVEIEGASKLVALFTEYGDDKLYMGTGLISSDAFITDILPLTPEHKPVFLKTLSETQETVLYLDGIREDYILFRFPMYESIHSPASTMNFCFTADILETLLWPVLNSSPGYVDLSLGDQKITFHSDGELGLVKLAQSPSFLNDYLSVESEIEGTETTIAIHNSTSDLFKEVASIQRNQLIFIIFGLSLSVFIAIYLYYIYCRMLRNVTENIERRTVSEKGFFGFLEKKVGSIIDENNAWKVSAQKKQFYLKQQVVFQMFKGLYTEKDSLNKVLEIYELALHEEYFCVVGIVSDKPQKLLTQIDKEMQDLIFCEIVIGDAKLIFALQELTSYDYTHDARNDFVKKMKLVAKQAGVEKIAFCVSRVYNDTLFINSAYMEALYGAENLGQEHNNTVMFSESSLLKKGAELNILNEEMEEFRQFAVEKKEKQLLQSTNKMIETISSLSISSEYRNYLKYNIMQVLLLGADNKNVENIIGNISNNESFKKEMSRLITAHCKQNKHDFEHIIEYINNNYSRFDLSLDEVAEYSGFAKTYLSRLFKNKIKMSYIDYLSSLRLERAKYLLEQTDMPISDVVKNVGYIDIPTFRRKFQSIYKIKISDIKRNTHLR